MESLGLLQNLKILQPFTFKDTVVYAVVSKNNNKVQYRRIDRGCKSDPKVSFRRHIHKGEKHSMNIIYEHDGNVEVFDFLPF